jgi:hypothetical protein
VDEVDREREEGGAEENEAERQRAALDLTGEACGVKRFARIARGPDPVRGVWGSFEGLLGVLGVLGVGVAEIDKALVREGVVGGVCFVGVVGAEEDDDEAEPLNISSSLRRKEGGDNRTDDKAGEDSVDDCTEGTRGTRSGVVETLVYGIVSVERLAEDMERESLRAGTRGFLGDVGREDT